MLTPHQIEKQINGLIKYLVEVGLADDQGFAFQRTGRDNLVHVTFDKAENVSIALKNRSYTEVYQHLKQVGAFNAKMLDGGLIQMMYLFEGSRLQRHRLAFFSSPHLEEYQNNPALYAEDEIHGDVIARNIVPFPLRFDYDARSEHHRELLHPKSHLSLGQYENCRIPVTHPMTPFWFIDFILRNFYNTESNRPTDSLPSQFGSFVESILPAERGIVHISVPP